ncbi:MAG: hypothetical protein QY871_00115 [Dehalococcoides mccartyi]|uniref:hypothetical protein n=1 Tax=Dehalococcoides mccartyi TaxID=61435 RepID=UPI0025C8A259|nr:hypothetical protein [Dehalococcoides mccartyi]MDN4185475.1 hypothetical protein [Dehalococcoides mccartyi]
MKAENGQIRRGLQKSSFVNPSEVDSVRLGINYIPLVKLFEKFSQRIESPLQARA